MNRRRSTSARPHLIAINRFYWPDHSATSQLLTDLCEEAVSGGFRVTVLTSRMRYDEPKACLSWREDRHGVRIRRLWTTSHGRSWAPARLIDYISFYLSSFCAVLFLARREDVVLVKTDPPLLSIPLGFAACLRGAKVVNWLQDLFPEVAASLGMRLADGPVGAVLRRLRNRSIKSAAVNVVISEGMASRLAGEGVPADTLRVRPNWAVRGIDPVARKKNPLRREWYPDDRFVIAYSGNLGRAHAVEAVCDLVRRAARLEGLSWLFIGGGFGIEAIGRTATETGADVRFRPYQPRAGLALSLSVGDLHLVSLDPACEGLIMPSKLYGIMAAGRGVLSLGSASGAVAREVEQGTFGLALDVTRRDRWADQIRSVMSFETADALGRRARQRFDSVYSPEQLMHSWLLTLRSVAPNHGASRASDSTMVGPDLRQGQTSRP